MKTKLPVPRVKGLLSRPSKAEVRLTKTQLQDVDAQGAINGDGYNQVPERLLLQPKPTNLPPSRLQSANMSAHLRQPNVRPNTCRQRTLPLFFSLLLPIQIFLGLHYRTAGILAATFLGLSTEITGYVWWVEIHFNPFLT